MNVETAFKSEISKIKRRIAIQAIHRALLNASLIFLAIIIVYFILNLAEIINYRADGSWYILPVALSLLAAFIIGFAKKSNLLNMLIDIDHRLKLQDRVSTAYESVSYTHLTLPTKRIV